MPDVARFEPHGALFAGADGLDVIRRLVALDVPFLALEHGQGQADAVEALAREAGFTQVERVRDLAGIERVRRCATLIAARRSARASPRAAWPSSPRTRCTGSRATPRTTRRSRGSTRSRGARRTSPRRRCTSTSTSLPETGPRTRAAIERLLPGKVTLILPGGLGVRVPFLAPVGHAVLQSSANLSGEPDARRLERRPRVHPTTASIS